MSRDVRRAGRRLDAMNTYFVSAFRQPFSARELHRDNMSLMFVD